MSSRWYSEEDSVMGGKDVHAKAVDNVHEAKKVRYLNSVVEANIPFSVGMPKGMRPRSRHSRKRKPSDGEEESQWESEENSPVKKERKVPEWP